VMKNIRETVIALGSVTEERDAVNSRRFRAALRTSVCWPGSKRSRICWRTRPPTCAASATSAMRTGAAGGRARWPFMAAGSTSSGCRMASRNWNFPALPARGLAVGDEPDAVSTRRFRRSVRLPDGDVASAKGDGTTKSAVSRKFVALSSAKLTDWLACRLWTCWRSRSTAFTSMKTWSWSRASTPRARSIRWGWSRGPPRMPPRFRRCSTTSSSAASTRR
jgi:hypothetical protein